MGAVRTTIDIDAPPEAVWEYVMNPSNSKEWVTIHRSMKGHSSGALREGYEMHQCLHLRGVNFDTSARSAARSAASARAAAHREEQARAVRAAGLDGVDRRRAGQRRRG